MCHSHRTRQLQRSIASLSLQRKASCAAWHNPCTSALSLIQHLESQVTCCGPALGDVDMLELLEASCSLRARSDPLEPKDGEQPWSQASHGTADPCLAETLSQMRIRPQAAQRQEGRPAFRAERGKASLRLELSRAASLVLPIRSAAVRISTAMLAWPCRLVACRVPQVCELPGFDGATTFLKKNNLLPETWLGALHGTGHGRHGRHGEERTAKKNLKAHRSIIRAHEAQLEGAIMRVFHCRAQPALERLQDAQDESKHRVSSCVCPTCEQQCREQRTQRHSCTAVCPGHNNFLRAELLRRLQQQGCLVI